MPDGRLNSREHAAAFRSGHLPLPIERAQKLSLPARQTPGAFAFFVAEGRLEQSAVEFDHLHHGLGHASNLRSIGARHHPPG